MAFAGWVGSLFLPRGLRGSGSFLARSGAVRLQSADPEPDPFSSYPDPGSSPPPPDRGSGLLPPRPSIRRLLPQYLGI